MLSFASAATVKLRHIYAYRSSCCCSCRVSPRLSADVALSGCSTVPDCNSGQWSDDGASQCQDKSGTCGAGQYDRDWSDREEKYRNCQDCSRGLCATVARSSDYFCVPVSQAFPVAAHQRGAFMRPGSILGSCWHSSAELASDRSY